MRVVETRIERLHHAPTLGEAVVAARVPKVLSSATRLSSARASSGAWAPAAFSNRSAAAPAAEADFPFGKPIPAAAAVEPESPWSEVVTSFGLSESAQEWLF